MIKRMAIMAALLAASGTAGASGWTWRVEITNVTKKQAFTPILAATHYGGVGMFELGDPASEALEIMAEGGDIGPLTAKLEAAGHRVTDLQTNGAVLPPGHSITLTLRGHPGQRLSLAGMLIPTNDNFVGVDGVFLPLFGSEKIEALAYDAGTEANDQDCANIPGPPTVCTGEGYSPVRDDVDFVHVSNGFHELGEGALSPAEYDWRNPVAIVKIARIRGW